MKTICVLLLSLISCSCEKFIQETGPPGGSVHIKCPYNGRYKGGHKYFCKAAKDKGCDILVSDEEHRQLTEPEPESQRLNLSDHKRDKYFLVTMTNLTGEDTGVYWCAAEKPSSSDRPDLLSEVHIQVTPVFVDEGDEATFRCPYAEGYQGNKKLFFSGECSIWNEDILIISEEGQIQAQTGRFSMYDNIDARVFSVTMRGLTAKDSGKYFCAVRTGLTDVCIELELVVRDVMTGAYGGLVNITCKYQDSHKQPLYLCRAKSVGHCELEELLVTSLSPHQSRYFLNDDKHDGVFTVTITDLRSEDAGIYWCGKLAAETKTVVRLKVTRASTKPTPIPDQITTSSVISSKHVQVSILPTILSVSLAVVVVVVMGVVVFMFYRHRRNKTPELSSDGANTRSNSQAPHPDRTYEEINDNPAAHPGPSTAFHPDPTYEEIKDNPALSAAAHPGPSTVYATAQLPTVLSDDPTYSTAELPTVLSDDPTYSTAELPTNPCADSTVSFNEGPTTASVTFRQENFANSTVSSDQ